MEAPVHERQHDSPDPRAAPAAFGRSKARMFGRWLVITLVLYLGILVVFSALQIRLIFPGSDTQGKPSSVVHPEPGTELVNLATEHDDKIVALFPALLPTAIPIPNRPPADDPLLLWQCHVLDGRDVRVRALPPDGCQCDDPRIRGLRHVGGQAKRDRLPRDGRRRLRRPSGRKDINPKKVVTAGWSLRGPWPSTSPPGSRWPA